MSTQLRFGSASLLGFALLAATPAGDIRISGPYTHENLSVFLIHSGRAPAANHFLTLQEAMDQKKVIVYETGNVNELSIENLSAQDVYIQSGDIVKGGRQDRVFPDDFVITSHSGKVPIASFCVEHGRWTRRGSEAADRFASSNNTLAGKSLKMAARTPNAQPQVWQQVAVMEERVAVNVAAGAPPRVFSPSGSMQLAMEDNKVMEATGAYVRTLAKIIDGKKDVVGYAFAINGKLNTVEVYGSPDLFRRMWPKLLNSSAVEAVAERQSGKTFSSPDVSAVRSAMADADRGRESSQQAGGRIVVVKKDSPKALLFETRQQDAAGSWIHKAYVLK